jgi:phosphopantothenoylcysteine decarboxylase/phosphopantothenate--cysteine ligase
MAATIVVGVTGSIAAYKAAELVRLLRARDLDVRVIMTAAATRYVGVLTFQALSGHPVAAGNFHDADAAAFPHIDLGQHADLILIAPCTANVIAKIAHGIADDLLTATVLARSAPLLIAPAMNDRMWSNPATQENLETLRRRDIRIVEGDRGPLACGTVGPGRMAEPAILADAAAAALQQ